MRRLEMSRLRTIQKQDEFYNKTIDSIKNNERKKRNARLRKGLYKKFFEEFAVILEYTKLKYGWNPNTKFKWVDVQGKVLNYDGEVYCNGKLIEKLEVTCPLLCKRDKDTAIQLNKYGYSSIEVGNLYDSLKEVKKKVFSKTLEKNNKSTYDSTITLVIYLYDNKHFFDGVDICTIMLEELKNDLLKECYQFKQVYVLQKINNKSKLLQIK